MSVPAPTVAVRTIVVHYHLYKNAGTSVDAALQKAFGSGWESWEGDGPVVTPADLSARLLSNAGTVALSSHRASLPVPEIEGVRILPIVFVRHPLDRIRSVYAFARRQKSDMPGARNAKRMDFPEFVEWRLSRPADRSFRNFQTVRLAPGGEGSTDLARALDAVSRLPYVGLVEEYELSVARLQELLRASFPDVAMDVAWANRTPGRQPSLTARLATMAGELGPSLYSRVESVNQDDLVLWDAVRRQYQGA